MRAFDMGQTSPPLLLAYLELRSVSMSYSFMRLVRVQSLSAAFAALPEQIDSRANRYSGGDVGR